MSKFKIGDKVVPVSKSYWGGLEESIEWEKAQEKNQQFLFVNSFDGVKILCHYKKTNISTGDFFLEKDLVLYEEECSEVDGLINSLEGLVVKSSAVLKELKDLREAKAKEDASLKIIEEAKEFVQKYQAVRAGQISHSDVNYAIWGHYYETEFVSNEDKGKTTAIVYLLEYGTKRQKKSKVVGRAICAKDDVFNKHIGEAIALGRALEINVDKFINAFSGK